MADRDFKVNPVALVALAMTCAVMASVVTLHKPEWIDAKTMTLKSRLILQSYNIFNSLMPFFLGWLIAQSQESIKEIKEWQRIACYIPVVYGAVSTLQALGTAVFVIFALWPRFGVIQGALDSVWYLVAFAAIITFRKHKKKTAISDSLADMV